jgi:hypothetical protein
VPPRGPTSPLFTEPEGEPHGLLGPCEASWAKFPIRAWGAETPRFAGRGKGPGILEKETSPQKFSFSCSVLSTVFPPPNRHTVKVETKIIHAWFLLLGALSH